MLGRLCFKYLNAIIVSGNPIYSKEYIYTIKLYSELDLNVCMVNGVSFLKKYEIVFCFWATEYVQDQTLITLAMLKNSALYIFSKVIQKW